MDSSSSEFAHFLNIQYGISNTVPFSCVNNAAVSTLFLGDTPEGRKILIKRSLYGELCANEHVRGSELYLIDKRYFAEQLCYCDTPPFFFTAQAYMPGIRIIEAIKARCLTDEQKLILIEDLRNIFLALKKSNVVHRDIHYNNILIHNGHLLLVDFQIAVQKEGYQELDVYRNLLSLVNHRGYHLNCVAGWDDAHTLLGILRLIGSAPLYEKIYAEIEQEIAAHIGTDTIWYPLPTGSQLRKKYILARLKSLFALKKKKRRQYRFQAKIYDFLTRYADVPPHARQFPLHNEFEEFYSAK